MTLLLLVWLVFVAAAGCIAVGALWGRDLPQPGCARGVSCAHRCPGCPHTTEPGPEPSRRER